MKGGAPTTGRDLIVYILTNNLEDKPVFEDEKLIGFLTLEQAALEFKVGIATVEALIKLNKLNHVQIGDTIYIPECDDHTLNIRKE